MQVNVLVACCSAFCLGEVFCWLYGSNLFFISQMWRGVAVDEVTSGMGVIKTDGFQRVRV